MTLIEQIERQLHNLPMEKQTKVLDFILFLRQRVYGMPGTGEEERGQHIRAALQTLALNTFGEIGNPGGNGRLPQPHPSNT